jgi:hypothetical protein
LLIQLQAASQIESQQHLKDYRSRLVSTFVQANALALTGLATSWVIGKPEVNVRSG